MLENASFRQRLAEIEIELQALEYSELRTLAALSVGKAPGPESSILKIVGTELAQKMSILQMVSDQELKAGQVGTGFKLNPHLFYLYN